jgi:hypothetical protein
MRLDSAALAVTTVAPVLTLLRTSANRNLPEHDPEKWIPVFRKDHAQTKRWSRMTTRRNVIMLYPRELVGIGLFDGEFSMLAFYPIAANERTFQDRR